MRDIVSEQGRVYAVDVGSNGSFTADSLPHDGDYCGWRHLVKKLNPFATAPKVPSIASLMWRVTGLGERHRREREAKADLLFKPPLSEFGTLDLKSYERIVELGYRYAEKELESGGF